MKIKSRKTWRFIIFGLLSLVVIVFLEQQVYAQSNIPNIAGQWTYRANVFESDGTDCVTDGRGHETEKESIVTINQNGNQFTSTGGISYMGGRSPASTDALGEGTIVNNQIQSRYQKPNSTILLSWSGVLSPDGATISGNASCVSRGTRRSGEPFSFDGSFGFALTKRSQPSQSQTNSPSVTPQPRNPGGLRPL